MYVLIAVGSIVALVLAFYIGFGYGVIAGIDVVRREIPEAAPYLERVYKIFGLKETWK